MHKIEDTITLSLNIGRQSIITMNIHMPVQICKACSDYNHFFLVSVNKTVNILIFAVATMTPVLNSNGCPNGIKDNIAPMKAVLFFITK